MCNKSRRLSLEIWGMGEVGSPELLVDIIYFQFMYLSFEKYIGKRKTSYRALLVSHFVVFIFELILLLIFFNRKRIEKKILFLRLFLVKIRSEIPIEKVSTLELFDSKIRGESHRTLKTFVNNLCFASFSSFFFCQRYFQTDSWLINLT